MNINESLAATIQGHPMLTMRTLHVMVLLRMSYPADLILGVADSMVLSFAAAAERRLGELLGALKDKYGCDPTGDVIDRLWALGKEEQEFRQQLLVILAQ